MSKFNATQCPAHRSARCWRRVSWVRFAHSRNFQCLWQIRRCVPQVVCQRRFSHCMADHIPVETSHTRDADALPATGHQPYLRSAWLRGSRRKCSIALATLRESPLRCWPVHGGGVPLHLGPAPAAPQPQPACAPFWAAAVTGPACLRAACAPKKKTRLHRDTRPSSARRPGQPR